MGEFLGGYLGGYSHTSITGTHPGTFEMLSAKLQTLETITFTLAPLGDFSVVSLIYQEELMRPLVYLF